MNWHNHDHRRAGARPGAGYLRAAQGGVDQPPVLGHPARRPTPASPPSAASSPPTRRSLLVPFGGARSALEVGCGTGHFTAWLADRVPRVVGLDRTPAILAEARRRQPGLVLVLGEAHSLPFRPRAVERSVFVATLEFLERPAVALAEAVRVSRRRLLAVALNRWSPGGSPGAGAPRLIGPCLRRRATSACRPCARWRPEPQDRGSPSSAGPAVCSPTAWGRP